MTGPSEHATPPGASDDDAFIEGILRMVRGSAPLPAAAPGAPMNSQSAGNEATAARDRMQPGATGCNQVQPLAAQLEYAKRSHGGEAAAGTPAPPPGTMSPRKIRAARLLLAGGRVADVAASVQVSRQTIWRWVKDPVFQAEVRRQAASAVPLGAKKGK